jgi:hypothetical protein
VAPFTFYIPSGFVPGDVDGDHRRLPSLFISGEAEGLDCVFKILSKVISLYFKDQFVIFLFSKVLLVTCTTT